MKQINDYTPRHLTALALALLLVGLLCVPAVSAETIIDEELYMSVDTSTVVTNDNPHASGSTEFNQLFLPDIQTRAQMTYVGVVIVGNAKPSGMSLDAPNELTYSLGGITRPCTVYYQYERSYIGTITATKMLVFFDQWDIGSLTGLQTINFSTPLLRGSDAGGTTYQKYPGGYFGKYLSGYRCADGAREMTITSYVEFKNHLIVTDDFGGYSITLKRVLFDKHHPSRIALQYDTSTVFYDEGADDFWTVYPSSLINNITVSSSSGYLRSWSLHPADTPSPTDPGTVYRQGTVTMTDNNGTTITGFEVTAVNAYTNEEHTVATETDVAVMTLPMDRTIDIRNPQTGIYEEAPIGYYRFYGQSSGYKMLNEGGIQVSVMPEKYGSYQLCDIRVTQEIGYLTGKHQFQIRSRSDNSILQSGTISAKSATTGEWYNTTVTEGIASLILPYDTSNTQSQYAGNYYVYATSPGYKDSDYGTQIVVMPHTVSEIHNILLTPIGGIPPAGNVTLRIQVFSETGPGVVNAEIFIAGVIGEGQSLWDTYTASSTGYLAVSVPGNSTYDIVASGAGYYDSARRVEVFNEDPGLIEIKLYLSGAPTPTVVPTTQPTGWVTATPTQTTPPIQEDNIIGLSVKGLAKGFGIDYDTALLMFGLMIVFGAGGIVMNSVKGGAMEFIAGSIVGTFIAFALGLIPIWIFIIIAVVFGAYVLRVFVQGGQ